MKIANIYPEQLPVRNARSISVVNTSSSLSKFSDTTLIYQRSGEKADIEKYYSVDCSNIKFIPISKKLVFNSNKIFNYNLKRILDRMDFDIFYVRHLKTAKSLINNKPKCSKVIYECHEIFSKNNTAVSELEEFVLENSDGLTFINDTLKGEISKSFNIKNIPKKTIHNGCGFKFDFIEKDFSQINEIYYIGNFHPWKGVDFSIKAMKYFPNLKLKIIGVGQRMNELKKIKNDFNLNNVDFLGYKSRTDIKNILAKAKLAIIPNTKSLFNYYSTPIKLYEYLSASCIVLSSDMPTIKEIIVDNKNGFMFTTGNMNSYIDTIKKILAKPNEELAAISYNAYETSKKFSWDNRARQIIEFSEELLNETF